MYQYKVVPFIGKVKSKEGAEEVALQLQNLINSYSQKGWILQQVVDVNIEIAPGCLPALSGAKQTYTRYDQLIFRREVQSNQ